MAELGRILILALLSLSVSTVYGVPAFIGQTTRTVYLNENPEPGSYVMTAFASDPDGGAFTFSITPTTQFTIDANSGRITVNDPLTTPIDREATAQITFTVNLLDSGGSSVATLTVTAVLGDVNDNSPVWRNRPSAAISLPEDTPVGSLVYALVVNDADLAQNADITFRITSPTDGTFAVHPKSGVVTLTNQLNHLIASSYTITVLAEDQGVPTRSTSLSFTVNVGDVIEPPPAFTQTHYSASIDEGTYAATPANNIISVVAIPEDAMTTVVYRMVSRGDASDSLFSVSSTGAVNVVGNLDRESVSSYTINVDAHAQDSSGTVRSRTSTATVIITVLDVNDNSPVIGNPPSEALVLPETHPAGTALYTLEATDLDTGANAEITYVLESPTNGPFSVGATTGVVHQTGTFDYETASSYTLTIRAQDGGEPSRSALTTLTVNIVDVPDLPPSFSETVYIAEIVEGVYSAHIVRTVSATTSLTGCVVRYSQQMRGDATDTLFSVDPSSGVVTLTGTLDRESVTTYTITITAFAADSATPTVAKTRAGHTSVVVTVTDANDNAPTFFNDIFTGSVPESAGIGDIAVAGISAFDLDSGVNRVFRFAIADPTAGLPFAVDANTGVITVSGALDYETTQSYAFMIIVQETLTTDMLSSQARIEINVLNENDNQPSFSLNRYEFTIAENQAAQALVTTSPAGLTMIQASDMDLGVFGAVTYRLEGFGATDGSRFAVNAMGQISTLAMLDYEERSEYHLTLFAEDGGGTLTNPFITTTLIVIRVTDVNDHPPVLNPSMFSVILIENIVYPGFLTVRATDGDPPNTPNSRIGYSIANADGSDSSMHFSIDSTTGSISAQNLDHEAASTHNLRITATDMGTPAMTATALLTVTIRDGNDLSPVFNPSVYSANLNENHPVNSAIGTTVTASDPEGHSIQYNIDSTFTDSAFFRVDRTSGTISLAHELNYDPPDNHRTFSFQVLAVDDASPPRTGTATVMVNVAGVNDNTPVITTPSATFSIVEDMGTSVPYTLTTVQATDQDGDTITYALNPTSTFFSIDSSSGDITQVATLDRETASSHMLTVTACDGGNNCDNLNLFITVTDYNDNPPSFVSLAESHTVSECDTDIDYRPVATLSAQDTADIGDNARVTYSSVSGDTSRLEVDTVTGVVRITPGNTWDYETGDRSFSLTVRATDNPNGMPQLSTTSDATVTVTLTDCNDNPPVFGQNDYAFTLSERTTGPSANEVVFSGISVSDNDATSANTQQSFAIVGGVAASTNNWFDVDSSTGEIFIRSGEMIDREDSSLQLNSMGQGILSFDVMVTNTAPSATFSATATVTVTINDINDLPPVIDQMGPITVDVVEHVRNQSILTVISATDDDLGDNAHISYSIASGNTNNLFVIDSETGIVRVNGDLDQEGATSYTLVLQAENDLATGTTPDTITVMVTVIDSNDFSPVFTQTRYITSINEFDEITGTPGIAPGSTIGPPVSATDADGTETLAGQLEYAIASGHFLGNDQLFDMPLPSQGAVVVLRPDLINYETHRQFDLVVIAYDLVSPINLRRQNSTHFVINVVDINDNPPVLSNTMFTGTVREEQPPGEMVLVTPSITGADPDQLGGAESITFSLVSGSPFSISSNGNLVTTTGRLDRETTDTYTVAVVAQDSGGHITNGMLVVTVTDVNDQPPRFLQTSSELTVNIPENHPIYPDPASTIVQTVEATDDDLDNNAIVTYLLRNGGGFFEIDSRSGEIRLVSPLDREGVTAYRLNVTATDGTLSSSIIVVVNIDPVNDNNPVFTAPVFTGTVPEDAVIGTTVTGIRLNATDLDPQSNITYLGGEFAFSVTSTGFIVTSDLLDRETRDFYSFLAQATDGFLFALEKALIEITVLDINDEAPMFDEALYETEAIELTPANVIILIVNANDNDIGINAEIRYSISNVEPPSLTGNFSIDPVIGSIAPTSEIRIDSSDPVNITLTITATDQGAFSLTGTSQVFLRLVDRNLHLPNFTLPHYSFTVSENMNNTLVGTVFAREPTDDLNTEISYSIVRRTSGADNFWIGERDGRILTVSPLDREERDIYTFSLAAVDNDDPPLTGFATVTVRVSDENDNEPYFDPESYPIAISESTSVNSTVIRVSAYDDDIDSNGELTYQIMSGDTSVFAVSSTDGVITTKQELDRERITDYVLIVGVEDGGTPPLRATANVSILITDVNDNSPTFTAGAVVDSTPLEIPEDAEPLTLVTTIQAEDPDFQLNGIIVYTFENLTTSKGPFQIDRETGAVTLRSGPDGRLDRETQSSYDLTVIASDQRGFGPEVRSTAGTFRINIGDVNDSIPTFVSPIYEYTLPEDFALNTKFLTVEGTDLDIGSNAIIYYHIIGDSITNTTCTQQFCIDNTNGDITLTSTLDRETTDQHLFTIAVSNQPVLRFNESTGAPEDASTGSVSVVVTDSNDQAPVFVPETLFAAIAEEAPFGTTITTLQATDLDIGNGSVVWFEILTPMVPYLVDRDSGDVTTAGVFSGLSGARHEVAVRAFDNMGNSPTLTATATMIVQVFKTSEQVILTFKRPKEDIEAKIDRIHSALTAVTNARITITAVRVQQTINGEVDITGTDVLFFALDPLNGNVVNPSIVIRIIDENYRVVSAVFSECMIDTILVHPEPLDDTFVVPIWLWVVIAVLTAAVICMCCCFLLGCVVERRRSRRWKKKAALDDYKSVSDAYASQMHDYQANPLWVAPYDNWSATSTDISGGSTTELLNPMYESQELTFQMFQDTASVGAQSSEGNLLDPSPDVNEPDIDAEGDEMYESQEFVFDYKDDDSLSGPELSGSHERLVRGGRANKHSTPQRRVHYEDDLLAEAVGDSLNDDEEDANSKTSFI